MANVAHPQRRIRSSAAMSSSEWSGRTEAASLALRDPLLAQALQNYERLDDPAQKMQLTYEVAQTRGAELTLAYGNLVMVVSGFKRSGQSDQEVVSDTPCVVFVVRRKWRAGHSGEGGDQCLPRHLLAYAQWQGERVLVALPTDVQRQKRFAQARPQSMRAVCVRRLGHGDDYGTLTAIVELRAGGTTLRQGLSPLHVLSWGFPSGGGTPVVGNFVERAKGKPQQSGAPTIGDSNGRGGQLVNGPAISFDAQLLELNDEATARSMLSDMPLSASEAFVKSAKRFHDLVSQTPALQFEFLIPGNHPAPEGQNRPRLFATYSTLATHALGLPYQASDGRSIDVHQWELIELICLNGQGTIPGDSGAAVVLWRSDGKCTFVGMHVAASDGVRYIVPSWQLFFAPNYFGSLPDDCEMRPV